MCKALYISAFSQYDWCWCVCIEGCGGVWHFKTGCWTHCSRIQLPASQCWSVRPGASECFTWERGSLSGSGSSSGWALRPRHCWFLSALWLAEYNHQQWHTIGFILQGNGCVKTGAPCVTTAVAPSSCSPGTCRPQWWMHLPSSWP